MSRCFLQNGSCIPLLQMKDLAMPRNEAYRCPGCGATLDKPAAFVAVTSAVGSNSTITCPKCRKAVALGDVLSGRYDVGSGQASAIPAASKFGVTEIGIVALVALVIGGAMFMFVYRSFFPPQGGVPPQVAPAVVDDRGPTK